MTFSLKPQKKETMETLYVFIVSYMSIKEYLRV